MREFIESGLRSWGISVGDVTMLVVLIVLMLVVAWVVYLIARKWVARGVMKLTGKTATTWDDLMFDQHFFTRLGLLIAPFVVELFLFNLFDPEKWSYFIVLDKIIKIWITIAAILLVSAVLDGANRIYENYPLAKHRPLKVFIQIIKIVLYCAAGVIVISISIGKSPEALLVGMGAFAAVLMLVFKDTILGFVAGVQLLANKMVNIGDWIVMPSANADGEVREINLTTVKVQNWDMTISTIPTYKMVSESFTNWRGMRESNGRRIKRSVNIDVQSVHYLGQEELEELKKSKLLRNYITAKLWIAQNPDIEQGMLHFVRQLQPGPTGIPLEIYCFSARQSFVEYERVQADLFDHLFAVLPLFNLRIFQYPSDSLRVETFKS